MLSHPTGLQTQERVWQPPGPVNPASCLAPAPAESRLSSYASYESRPQQNDTAPRTPQRRDTKHAAVSPSPTAREMSAGYRPGGEGNRWLHVTSIMSLFASGNQKQEENTSVFIRTLREGKA